LKRTLACYSCTKCISCHQQEHAGSKILLQQILQILTGGAGNTGDVNNGCKMVVVVVVVVVVVKFMVCSYVLMMMMMNINIVSFFVRCVHVRCFCYFLLHHIVSFWPDCKLEGPLFSAEFVCLCVSDRHFYPSVLTDFDETCSQGPYSDLVWPRP